MRTLFINHQQSQCGIFEFGRNIGRALTKSSYEFLYYECASTQEVRAVVRKEDPDLIIYNYCPATMGWLNKVFTRKLNYPQIGLIHEVTQNVADRADTTLFDFHIAHDPTLKLKNPIVFKAGRLIPHYTNTFGLPPVPTIATFGFAGRKGHMRLVEMVQKEFDRASIRMNIPFATFGDTDGAAALAIAESCRRELYKKGVTLEISHEFLDQPKLLDFLAQNTINVFLYEDTGAERGISATPDLALAVDRPVGISRNSMFRHILGANPSICVDDFPLKEIIENGTGPLVPFCDRWNEEIICRDYEQIVDTVSEIVAAREKPALPVGPRKLSGLFVNCIESRKGIRDNGVLLFDRLKGSAKYSLDFLEITKDDPRIPIHYDFFFFNCDIRTRTWLNTFSIRDILPGVKITIIPEGASADPFFAGGYEEFDAYCVLDRNTNSTLENVFSFPPIASESFPGAFTDRFEEVLDNFRFDQRFRSAEMSVSTLLPLRAILQPTFFQRLKEEIAIRTRLQNFMKGKGLRRQV